MNGPTRRDLLGAGSSLTVGATLLAALPARQASAAGVRDLPMRDLPMRDLPMRDLPVQEPRPAPEFTFTDEAGAVRDLSHFPGKAFVVNFWATWCAPCVVEMPALDRMQAALAEDDILVLALASDRGGAAQVRPFYERVGLRHLGLWLDPRGAAARAFGVRAVPTTVILDRERREVSRLAGPADWDAAPMLSAVRGLIGAKQETRG